MRDDIAAAAAKDAYVVLFSFLIEKQWALVLMFAEDLVGE